MSPWLIDVFKHILEAYIWRVASNSIFMLRPLNLLLYLENIDIIGKADLSVCQNYI